MIKHGGEIYNHDIALDFSVNLNLLRMPESVKEAAILGVSDSLVYPDSYSTNLVATISESLLLPTSYILCGNGATDIIFSIAFSLRPKKALVLAPTFAEYENALSLTNCAIKYLSLKESNNFTLLETDSIKTDDLDMIFLCNPNNPTGQLISKSFITKLAKSCELTNTILVLDECFMDFVDGKEHFSMINELINYPNIILLKSFTKLYSMPGIRLAYCLCSNKVLLNRLSLSRKPWNIATSSQYAGIAALKENDYITSSLSILQQERAYLIDALRKANCRVIGSNANYIFFYHEKDLYEYFLTHSILIRDCSNYHSLSKGWYRIAVKDSKSNKEFIRILNLI